LQYYFLKAIIVEEKKMKDNSNVSGAIYFLTIIGAAVYFIKTAVSFWGGVLGILKAMVWPAIVIYKVLELLKL